LAALSALATGQVQAILSVPYPNFPTNLLFFGESKPTPWSRVSYAHKQFLCERLRKPQPRAHPNIFAPYRTKTPDISLDRIWIG